MANITDALSAYSATTKALGNESARTANGATGASEGPSFGAVLKTSLESAIEAQDTSEKVAAKAIVGKADMTEVLQAVNDAEIALNTVLAVRDRVVQAYEQVMRTPI